MPLQNAFWHLMMPYRMEPIENPIIKNVYLPLNRWYKPLGMATSERVRYDRHLSQAIVFARKLNDDQLYLYDDGGCRDFAAYLKVVEKLMSRKHWVVATTYPNSFPMHERSLELLKWAASQP